MTAILFRRDTHSPIEGEERVEVEEDREEGRGDRGGRGRVS